MEHNYKFKDGQVWKDTGDKDGMPYFHLHTEDGKLTGTWSDNEDCISGCGTIIALHNKERVNNFIHFSCIGKLIQVKGNNLQRLVDSIKNGY